LGSPLAPFPEKFSNAAEIMVVLVVYRERLSNTSSLFIREYTGNFAVFGITAAPSVYFFSGVTKVYRHKDQKFPINGTGKF
jgi:hypothetical protein